MAQRSTSFGVPELLGRARAPWPGQLMIDFKFATFHNSNGHAEVLAKVIERSHRAIV